MIALDQVTKTYPGDVKALKGISLQIKKGEFVFVVGQSGSGKTTLFKLLLKEMEPTSGTIYINNKNLGRLRRRRVPKLRRGIGVALARALVNNPPLLFADEPTGNLDPKNSWEIMKLLEAINMRGTTVVVVTHNKEIVEKMQKRVITMSEGVIISDERKGGYIYE